MASITTRNGKGSALTHTELDNNFINLNNDKLEVGTASSTYLALSGGTMTGTLAFAAGQPTATMSSPNIVQLTNSTSSTSTTTAATPASVKSAFDLGNAALQRDGGTSGGNSGVISWVGAGALDLNVASASNALTITQASTGGGLKVCQTGSGDALLVEDHAGDASPFVIKADGRVGIGLTAPSEALHVIGRVRAVSAATGDGIILEGGGTGSNSLAVTIKPAALAANRTLTLADGDTVLQGGTMAITGGTLAQFASTTSAQLAGVISDETGSGALVFATSPSLTTPTLGVASGTSLSLSSTATATSFAPTGSTAPANGLFLPAANAVGLATNSTERARIDSSGRFLVGTSTTTSDSRVIIQGSSSDSAGQGILRLSLGSTAPADGFALGALVFTDSGHISASTITAQRDGGTWTSGTSHPTRLLFTTTENGAPGPAERMRITSAGAVGIATSSPGAMLDVRGFSAYRGNAFTVASFCANNTLAPLNIVQSTNGTSPGISAGQNSVSAFQPLIFLTSETIRQTISSAGTITLNCNASTSPFQVQINSSEVARIDSSGRFLVGTSASSNFIGTGTGALFQVQDTAGDVAIGIEKTGVNGNPANIFFRKTRATTAGGVTSVIDGDELGSLNFSGTDGTGSIRAARITASVDGTPGANDMPGRLVFSTTADGASSPTERLRIASNGRHTINSSAHSGSALSTTAPANLYTSTGTYTDTSTAASGTVSHGTIVAFDNPAIAANNATVTYTNASTLYIDGAPTNGTNVTISNPYALYVNQGTSYLAGDVGIGTAAPSQKLHVIGNIRAAAASTQDAVIIAGRAGGSSSYAVSITPTTLTDNRTLTLADGNTTLVAGTMRASYTDTTTATSKTLANYERCVVTASGLTLTLPATPSTGFEVVVAVGDFRDTTLARNGVKIMNLDDDLVIDTPNATVSLFYDGNNNFGWRVI